MPCKKCQSIRKSNAASRNKKNKIYYYNRLVKYCEERGGKVLETKWTGTSPRQLQRQEAIERDKAKDEYCRKRGIPLYRMEVPFRGFNKWDYEDYYRYINTKLKFIVNMSHGGNSYA